LLERTHDFAKVVEVMEWARSAGFNNISLDLIYGLPGQDLQSWKRSVTAALELVPEHLSLYCLTIEPGTPMQRWLSAGRIAEPDGDVAAEQYEHAGEVLAQRGYQHYEISNWALPGYECRHNLTYWRNQAYLGLGAGAHGQANGYRYQLVKQPRVYIRRISEGAAGPFPHSSAVVESHAVSRQEAMSDTVITQLRLLEEGLDMVRFRQKFGSTLDDAYDGLVTQLVDWDLLRREDDRLLLSERGRFISNQIFYRFV
jgi:oxygen-independent coproporphyrinogen-3 oxidase